MADSNEKLTLKKPRKPNVTLEEAKKKASSSVIEREEVSYKGNGMDYSGSNFRGKDLTAKNELGNFVYNLKHADLSGVDFTNANLEGQNFQGAKLIGTNLTGANCKGADFRWSNMQDAITDDADFTDANLREVDNL